MDDHTTPEDLTPTTEDKDAHGPAAAIRDYNVEWANLFSAAVDKKKAEGIDLASEMLVRPAVLNLRKLIRGERFGDLKAVKDSTVLSAIQTVLDRSHPKKMDAEPPVRSFTQVNMTVYMTPGPPTSGGVPEKVQEIDVSPDRTRPIAP